MKISAVNFCLPKRQTFNKKQAVFTGKPKSVPENFTYAANPIMIYNLFKDGSYLDSHDDRFNPNYKAIRQRNFSGFSDCTSETDKKKFIQEYKNITGFPDLAEVSRRIEKEFVSSIKEAENHFYDYKYKCLSAGYDRTCSVGKGFAFPGSDLDKSYIILEGSSYNDNLNNEIVQKFSSYLWKNTDQRLLSYNHDTSFPTIMTKKQVRDMMKAISSRIEGMTFDKYEMQHLVDSEYRDLEKAAKFNIMVSDYFPKNNRYINSNNLINKETVKNFAYFIEAFRDGKEVISTSDGQRLKTSLQDEDFYKYSNVAQMRAMQNAISKGQEQKTKIIKRQKLTKEFNSYPIGMQYDFIVNLIRYCSEDQNKYHEYFNNDYNVKEKYKPLLGRLTKGDRDNFYIPEFEKHNDGYRMKYGKSNFEYIDLYTGYAPFVLWVDSNNGCDIQRVQENIDYIKRIEQFQNISIIQSPHSLNGQRLGFGLIQYRTADGQQIQEMRI